MEANLTTDKKRDYIVSGGVACPFCKSNQIVAGEIDVDGALGTGQVLCHNCGKIWLDVYKLADVLVYDT